MRGRHSSNQRTATLLGKDNEGLGEIEEEELSYSGICRIGENGKTLVWCGESEGK